MRDDKQFNLPHPETLRNWHVVSNFDTGINVELFRKLKDLADCMPELHRNCALLFDDMKIMKCLEYNKKLDQIDGFVDLGEELGRTNEEATEASVFMIRGLFKSYKLPVAYYFNKGALTTNQLIRIISNLVPTLSAAGLKVRVLVCDQAGNNRSFYEALQSVQKDHICL